MKKQKQPKLKGQCFICGEPAYTRDHIPPACLFPKPAPTDLITVPACDNHNQKSTLDDEYFSFFVATTALGSQRAQKFFNEEILERIKKRPKMFLNIMQNTRTKIEMTTPDGIIIGYKPGYRLDRDGIQNIFSKIVRGLYFHHFKKRLADGYVIGEFDTLHCEPQNIQGILKTLRLYEKGDRIFGYRFLLNENNDNESYWFFNFYDSSVVYLLATHDKNYDPAKEGNVEVL